MHTCFPVSFFFFFRRFFFFLFLDSSTFSGKDCLTFSGEDSLIFFSVGSSDFSVSADPSSFRFLFLRFFPLLARFSSSL
jgi:hypothetical protein